MDTAWLVLRTMGNFYALRPNRETRTSNLQGISGRKPPGSTWPHKAVLSPDKSRICTVHVEHENAADRRALDPCQRFYTVVASVPTSSCLIKMTQGFTLMREARVVSRRSEEGRTAGCAFETHGPRCLAYPIRERKGHTHWSP